MTKATFVKKAAAICVQAQEEREQISKELDVSTGGGSADQATAVMEILVSPVETMIVQIEELGSPAGEAKQVTSLLQAYKQGVAKLESDPTSPKLAWAFATADKKAEAYGLSACMI